MPIFQLKLTNFHHFNQIPVSNYSIHNCLHLSNIGSILMFVDVLLQLMIFFIMVYYAKSVQLEVMQISTDMDIRHNISNSEKILMNFIAFEQVYINCRFLFDNKHRTDINSYIQYIAL